MNRSDQCSKAAVDAERATEKITHPTDRVIPANLKIQAESAFHTCRQVASLLMRKPDYRSAAFGDPYQPVLAVALVIDMHESFP
ncbi:MAG TPA: hypothetical protein VEF34_01080 [Syntrophobacteraceae bacterium]|nr:hypothetical protein [Syntrophobacteraceae bacterium]